MTLRAGPGARGGDPGEPVTDRVGHVETHGVDYVPDSERHGLPRSLFPVWAAANMSYLYIVLGGSMVLLGLDIWQSIAVIVAGNLLWAGVGYLSTSGPSSGTPSWVVTRAMYGIRGNRFLNVTLGWSVAVAYEAISLALGSLAGFALAEQLGIPANTGAKVAIVLATAVVTFSISVYGHATIMRCSTWFTWALTACVLVLGYYVLRHADWGYRTPADTAVHGHALWVIVASGFTIMAGGPLSWTSAADYARYLPADTSRKAVCWWTAVGGFVPAVLLSGLGVLAATAVDMHDAQTSLKGILPGWFYPVFLLVIVIGSIANNVLTAYSGGLALQSGGIPWSRPFTVIFDATIALGLTFYSLFISDFLSTMNSGLELSVAFLGPGFTIYAVDIFLRRNRYDGVALQDETPDSRFWYWHGVHPAGAAAVVIGVGAALLCVNTSIYTGPVASALGGADLSGVVGMSLGALVYAGLTLHRRRATGDPTVI
ncbi:MULTISPECIES: purine-cytosine permease family protein [unclassified Streptomyces]|uniref:purine-cytosine permease family protein n=1 Tax=unclassified Streptomyces TaxID=2593676 RepID=UPI0036F181B8